MSLDTGIRNILSDIAIIRNDIDDLEIDIATKQDTLGALTTINVNEVKANTITLAGTKIITRLAAKQDIIKDDNLLISYTAGLQAALNDLSDKDISLQSNIDKKQDIIKDENLLISYTAGLQAALNDLSDKDISLQSNIDKKTRYYNR
jgi:hypothetical protein